MEITDYNQRRDAKVELILMELCVGSWDILPRHGTFCSGTWGLPPTPWEYRGGGEGMHLLLRGLLCASLATSRAPIATI